MSLKPSTEVMQAAIQTARLNHTPFGAALAMGDQVFATGTGAAGQEYDFTAHAEFVVIRKFSEQVRKKNLSGFTLYSTCEPCADCLREIVTRGIQTVVYGCERSVVSGYVDQINVQTEEIISKSSGEIELHKSFMTEECETLLRKLL